MAKATHNGDQMSFVQKLIYAADGMRFQPRVTLLNVLAISFPVIYALCLGFYAVSIHRYQQDVLNQSVPTRIVIEPRRLLDAESRLTKNRLTEVSQMPGVSMVFPRIELGVRVSLDETAGILVPSEGTVPNDPSLTGDRLAWGTGLTSEQPDEVILGESLFRKLGGSVTHAGPTPASLAVEVGRTVNGKPESRRLSLRITGLVRHSSHDRIHVPLQLADRLDQWCANRTDQLPGDESATGSSSASDLVRTYALDGADDQIAHALERLDLPSQAATRGDSFVQLVSAGDIWFSCSDPREEASADLLSFLRETEGDAASSALSSADVLTRQAGKSVLRIAALDPSDPRWQEFGVTAPREGSLCALRAALPIPETADHIPARIQTGIPREFPVPADYVCTDATLRWLEFDMEHSSVVERRSIVDTTDRRAATFIAGELRQPVRASNGGQAWVLLEQSARASASTANRASSSGKSPQKKSRTRSRDQMTDLADRLKDSRIDTTVVVTADARFDDVRATSSTQPGKVETVVVRILPDTVFARISSSANRSVKGAVPAIAVCRRGRKMESGSRLSGHRLQVVRTIATAGSAADRREVWVPLSAAQRMRIQPRSEAVLMLGDWELVHARLARAARYGLKNVQALWPDSYRSLVPTSQLSELSEFAERAESGARSLDHRQNIPQLRIDSRVWYCLPISVGRSHRSAYAVLDPTSPLKPGHAVISTDLAASGRLQPVELTAQDRTQRITPTAASNGLPAATVQLDYARFRSLAFAVADSAGLIPVSAELTQQVRVADAVTWQRLREQLEAAGFDVELHTRVQQRQLCVWTIGKDETADTNVNLLRGIGGLRPPFLAAIPELSAEAVTRSRRSEESLTLHSADRHDPGCFRFPVVAGTWFSKDQEEEIVLSDRALARVLPTVPPRESIGRVIPVRFSRNEETVSAEELVIPLRIAGVIEAEQSFVSWRLLNSVASWQDNRTIYNATRNRFESVEEVHARTGYPRGTVFAKDIDSVEPVVKQLEAAGFETRHSLAEQESLRQLAWALSGIIVALVLGSALTAAANVWSTTAMNVQARTWEIGVLKAHGVGVRDILGIFGIQGLLVALAGYGLGTILVVVGEPAARDILASVFHLPIDGVLCTSILSADLLWMFLLVFAVTVTLCQIGVLVPAIGAARLSPVEALRRRA